MPSLDIISVCEHNDNDNNSTRISLSLEPPEHSNHEVTYYCYYYRRYRQIVAHLFARQ